MDKRYYKEYSHYLNREMAFNVYGYAGRPFLVFPAQSGRFYDFENFLMIDTVKWHLEQGKLQIFCVDSLDDETFVNQGQPRDRMEHFENYYNYICEEFFPRMIQIHHETSQSDYHKQVVTTGCSMGALHAMNFFLRRPDLFSGTFAMSGLYDLSMFMYTYMDDLVYKNSSLDNLANIPWHHPFVNEYKNKQILVTVGQGDYEEDALKDTRRLQDTLNALGVHQAQFEYWGTDTEHDWTSWRRQFPHYIGQFI